MHATLKTPAKSPCLAVALLQKPSAARIVRVTWQFPLYNPHTKITVPTENVIGPFCRTLEFEKFNLHMCKMNESDRAEQQSIKLIQQRAIFYNVIKYFMISYISNKCNIKPLLLVIYYTFNRD